MDAGALVGANPQDQSQEVYASVSKGSGASGPISDPISQEPCFKPSFHIDFEKSPGHPSYECGYDLGTIEIVSVTTMPNGNIKVLFRRLSGLTRFPYIKKLTYDDPRVTYPQPPFEFGYACEELEDPPTGVMEKEVVCKPNTQGTISPISDPLGTRRELLFLKLWLLHPVCENYYEYERVFSYMVPCSSENPPFRVNGGIFPSMYVEP